MEPDVLCIGETMVLLTPREEQTLVESQLLEVHVAGAESNVAAGMAHLGSRVSWFSRVGRDALGTRVKRELAKHGVDLSYLTEDPRRPTGLYLKDAGVSGSPVYYYRRGSAASAMRPVDLSALSLDRRKLCHVSGITPALSSECDELMNELMRRGGSRSPLISFDVNYRPGLWTPQEAAERLFELAQQADILMVGRDEAEKLWGTHTAQRVRDLFPTVPQVIVKDADVGATGFVNGQEFFVPALKVRVVEPVGAGDSFAAGYLSAMLGGMSPEHGLKLGHLMAAYTLTHVGDLPPWPHHKRLTELAHCTSEQWDSMRKNELEVIALYRLGGIPVD